MYTLNAGIDNLEDENNKVLLMTLHNAKGLEFNNVFLGGMEEGVFPGFGAMMSGDESEIEEERRLCYVGITRAKERLFLSAAKRRMLRGQTQYNRRSALSMKSQDSILIQNSVFPNSVLSRTQNVLQNTSMEPKRANHII